MGGCVAGGFRWCILGKGVFLDDYLHIWIAVCLAVAAAVALSNDVNPRSMLSAGGEIDGLGAVAALVSQ